MGKKSKKFDLQMSTLQNAKQESGVKKSKATVADKYHALKQKGERSVKRLRKDAESYGGKEGVDHVIGHVKSLAEKHLQDAIEKGEKYLKSICLLFFVHN